MMRPRELSRSLELFPARTPTLLPATHTNSYALGGRDVAARRARDAVRGRAARVDRVGARARVAGAQARRDRRDAPSPGSRRRRSTCSSRELGAAGLGARADRRSPHRRRARSSRAGSPTATTIVLEGPRDESWRVLHTPGHAPGHVCLFEERTRTVVVGDMVASVGTILIAPGDGDMQIYLAAARAARGARCDASRCRRTASRSTSRRALFRAVRRAPARCARRRCSRAVEARRAGRRATAMRASCPIAYDDTPAHLWPIAKLSLEAHLEKLEREGRRARAPRRAAIERARRAPTVPGGRLKPMWESSFVAVDASLLGALGRRCARGDSLEPASRGRASLDARDRRAAPRAPRRAVRARGARAWSVARRRRSRSRGARCDERSSAHA